jgi:hypothetical protein
MHGTVMEVQPQETRSKGSVLFNPLGHVFINDGFSFRTALAIVSKR